MQTVLIVDDWPPLRRRFDRALRRAGYLTLQAETGQAALALIRSADIHLILARERLADVEGTMLAETVRRRGRHDIVIILLTDKPAAARRALADGMVDAVLPRELDTEPAVTLIRGLLAPPVLHITPTIGPRHSPDVARA